MGDFDIIIAGCGTGGAATAIIAARAGLKTLVLDPKAREEIGKKICGDGIHINHYKFVKDLGIDFTDDELLNPITGMRVLAPNRTDFIHVKDDGYCINRRLFGQRLMKEAENAGGSIETKCRATGLIIENGTVTGVKTDRGELRAKIVVDATGVASALRKQLTFDTDFPKTTDPNDLAKGYREVVEIEGEFEHPNDIVIEYNNEIAPYGYIWYFPKSPNILNIGLGLKGPQDLQELYRTHVASHFKIKKVLDAGSWVLPMVRKPFDGFVANGFMIVGDAACQVNPLDGAGIGYSIRGGVMAANAAIGSINNPTRERLWPYNKNFMTEVGAKHAQSAIFATALGSLNNDDMNFVFKSGLVASEDVRKAYEGGMKLSTLDKIRKAIKGASRPHLLKKLNTVAKLTGEAKAHYLNYPSGPDGLPQWKADAGGIFERSAQAFGAPNAAGN